jgi:hypothetical protein
VGARELLLLLRLLLELLRLLLLLRLLELLLMLELLRRLLELELLLLLDPGTITVTLPVHLVSVNPAQFVAVAQNGKKYLPGAAVSNVKPIPASICSAVTVSIFGSLAASISPSATVNALLPVV